MPLRVVIRSDASGEIGSGHVMRCLTLAAVLREGGALVTFLSRDHPSNLNRLIAERGFRVETLPSPKLEAAHEPGHLAHSAWLGAHWQEDAAETLELLRNGEPPDWLIVDHYGIDEGWEHALRPSVRNVMVIDDLADRKHDCDLLLDQNLVDGMATRYAGRVPEGSRLLLGPTYALLQPIYAELRQNSAPRSGPVRRILVFFGAADRANLTSSCIEAFLALRRPDILLDVVIGATHANAERIGELADGHENILLHWSLPSLAENMVAADLAVGAGGSTTWERLCLRLPSIVVTLADNQVPVAAELHRRGLVKWLGNSESVKTGLLSSALANAIEGSLTFFFDDNESHEVDGYGAGRVSSAILEFSQR